MRVVVPGKKDCLQQKRGDAEECSRAARSPRTPRNPQAGGKPPNQAYSLPAALRCPPDPLTTTIEADQNFDTL